jgi:hypothetical protein
MSVEGKVKEAAGFVKDEAYEHGKSSESQKKAQEGRDLRKGLLPAQRIGL